MQRLASREVAALDPYQFLALTGKCVIHPGGRASTVEEAGQGVPFLAYVLIARRKPIEGG